jgi:hypothetical protein
VLGEYVLVGWNPPDAEIDKGWHVSPVLAAPSPVAKDTAQRQYLWWAAAAVAIATTVGFAFGIFPSIRGSLWLMMFVATTVLAAMWAVHLQRQAANSSAQLQHYLGALFISLGLMAGGAVLALGIRLSSTPEIGAGAAMWAASLLTLFLAPLWWRESHPATTHEAASIV